MNARQWTLIVFLLLTSAAPVLAQVPTALPPDTSQVRPSMPDSLKSPAADTTSARVDSVVRLLPIPGIGSIEQSPASRKLIADSTINYLDYYYPGDILSRQQGVILRDLGSPGQYHTLTVNGAAANAVAVMADGIGLNEPMTGAFDLNLYPVEHASGIEFIGGTRAFYYGFNATGGAINFVSKNKKALHPSTRIRYTEAAYGQSVFDGSLSQDILRGFNVTGGFQHATTGGRYDNSRQDAWNGRLKFRYNISNRLNVFASGMYNQTRVGLYGGVVDTLDQSIMFERLLTTVVNPLAYEKVTRYDVQVGAAARLVGDSTLVSRFTLYHTTSLREYRDEELTLAGWISHGDDDAWSQIYGAKLTQTLLIGRQKFDAGAEWERRGLIASSLTGQELDSRAAFFAKTELSPVNALTVSLFTRFDQVRTRNGLGFGGDAAFSLGSSADLFGGYSHSFRFPTIQERYWNDSLVIPLNFGDPERHDLFEAGIRRSDEEGLSGELKFFHRNITNFYTLSPTGGPFPKYYSVNGGGRTIDGVSGQLGWRIGAFYLEGMGQYSSFSDSTDGVLPRWYGTGGIYYWNNLLSGHLGLKAGLRGRLVPAWPAPGFDSRLQRILPDHNTTTQTVGVLDIIFIARIGDAYLHFVFDNFFSRNYYLTSIYPETDRQARFGVSWDFLD